MQHRVQASTYTVCAGGGCSATTITSALTLVDTVSGGDQIQVEATYDPSGETYPINFPDVTTTIACDTGATIGQTNLASPTAAINLSTSSTVRDCTFGYALLMTKNVGVGLENPSGFRIENNIFSTVATSSIYLYRGGTNFVIQGNTNINYLTIDAAQIVQDGVIQNNSFYGRIESGQAGYMLSTTASSSRLWFYNNDFASYAGAAVSGARTPLHIVGTDIVFATNTVRFMTLPPSSVETSIIFSAEGNNYIGGNKIESSTNTSCNGVAIYPTMGSGAVQLLYIFDQNTIAMRCNSGLAALNISDGNNPLAVLHVTTTNSIFYGAVAVSRAISLNRAVSGSVITLSNDWNGFYGFGTPIEASGVVTTFTLGTNTFYRDPVLMVNDVSSLNDLELAPFSFYLDARGTHRIGATTSTRRTVTNILQGGTVDYSAVDATTTTKIPEYISSGDTVRIGAGTYRTFSVDDSNGLSDISIQGAGTNTVIDARTGEDGITFANVTTSAISRLVVQNASTTVNTYTLSQAVYSASGTDYGDAVVPFDLDANTPLLLADGPTCDFSPYDDGEDISALVNNDTENWHVALITMGGAYHLTFIIPGGFANSAAALEAACVASDPSISVNHFISDVFVRSGSQMIYSAAAISAASATLNAPLATPAITVTGGSRAGIKFTNTGGSSVSQVTSTNNGYGIWFSDTSAFGNVVTSTVFADNILSDVRHVGNGRNTFENVTFDRAASLIEGVGDLLVKFYARVKAVRIANEAVLSGVSASSTDASLALTSLGATDGSGYSAYVSLPAYILTPTTTAVTNGGYNPYTFGAAITGYNVTSSQVTLSSVSQNVTLALLSTSLPTAPTTAVVSSVGTTTSTVSWTDNSDEEAYFTVDLMSPSAGESFPGTLQAVAANATSYALTGLTPSQTYQVRVSATNLNGTSAYVTSSVFTTLPATPTAPDLHGMSLTSVAVTRVNAATNGTSTQYAIYDVTAVRYRDASGAATSTAVWQTTSTWDVLLVSGLTCGTSYGFSTVARNTDLVQSATSTVGSVSTLDCEPAPSSGGGGSGGGGGMISPIQIVGVPANVVPIPSVPTTPVEVTVISVGPDASPAAPSPAVWSLNDVSALTAGLGISQDPQAEQRVLRLLQTDLISLSVNASLEQLRQLQLFVTYGNSWATVRLGEGERRAVVRDALETMKTAAISGADLDRMTRGEIPLFRNLTAEREQLTRVRSTFRTLFGHDPNFKDVSENLAWNTMMYRIRFPRDLRAERLGIIAFRNVFGRTPQTPSQWAVVRVQSYIQR